MRRWFALISSTLVISGCALRQRLADGSPRTEPTPQAAELRQRPPEQTTLEIALEQVHRLQKVDYKISGADLLEISVYQQPDLERKLRVSQNGTVSFPLVGIVKVGGLSVAGAEAALSKRLQEFIIDPQVSIFIKEYGNKKVFVLGEVKTPGSYELPTESRLTVLEAISLAGGFTAIAATDRTKVIRTVEGKSQSFVVEVSAITKRGEKDKDLPLEPNDVIYVPQSFF